MARIDLRIAVQATDVSLQLMACGLAAAGHGDGTAMAFGGHRHAALVRAVAVGDASQGVVNLLLHLLHAVEGRGLLHGEGVVDASAEVGLYDDVCAVIYEQLLDEFVALRASGVLDVPEPVGESVSEGHTRRAPKVEECCTVDDAGGDGLLERPVADVVMLQLALGFGYQLLCCDAVLAAALKVVVLVARLLLAQVLAVGVDVIGSHVARLGAGQAAVLHHLVLGGDVLLAQHVEVEHRLLGAHGHRRFQGFVDVIAIAHVEVGAGIAAVIISIGGR